MTLFAGRLLFWCQKRPGLACELAGKQPILLSTQSLHGSPEPAYACYLIRTQAAKHRNLPTRSSLQDGDGMASLEGSYMKGSGTPTTLSKDDIIPRLSSLSLVTMVLAIDWTMSAVEPCSSPGYGVLCILAAAYSDEAVV